MRINLLVLLVLAYGIMRARMPQSLWSQAPDLRGYLLGALVPPVLDLVAMGALALYAMNNFRRFPRLARIYAILAVATGLYAFLTAAVPIVSDLRHSEFRAAVVTQKLADQRVELRRSPDDPATSSLRLPNREQYERVPTGIEVEFRVAPRTDVGYVSGVLE